MKYRKNNLKESKKSIWELWDSFQWPLQLKSMKNGAMELGRENIWRNFSISWKFLARIFPDLMRIIYAQLQASQQKSSTRDTQKTAPRGSQSTCLKPCDKEKNAYEKDKEKNAEVGHGRAQDLQKQSECHESEATSLKFREKSILNLEFFSHWKYLPETKAN